MLAGRVVLHGTLSVPECDDGAAMLLFQQFPELFAAKLVVVPSLPCRDLAPDNSGHGETEDVFKLVDSKDKTATLQGGSPSLMFRILMTQVEGGCQPEVSVNVFQDKATARVDVPETKKGEAK